MSVFVFYQNMLRITHLITLEHHSSVANYVKIITSNKIRPIKISQILKNDVGLILK